MREGKMYSKYHSLDVAGVRAMAPMNRINIESNKLIFPIYQGIEWLFDKIFAIFLKIVPATIRGLIETLSKSKATHNALGLILLNSLGGLLLLVTQIKMANVLGPSIYGIYAYCLAIGEVGANFVRYGRQKTMLRDLVQHPERQNFLISNTFMLSLVNLLIFLCVVSLFHSQLDIPLSPTYMLLILSPCLISLDLQMVYESFNLISWHTIYNFLQKLLFLIPIWIAIACFKVPLWLIAVASCLSWFIVLTLQYREITSNLNLKICQNVNFKSILSLYKENFLIALACCFEIAFAPLIRLVLNHYADSGAVGIFSAGLQIYSIALFLLMQIARVGNPRMARIGREDVPMSQRKLFLRHYLCAMIACISPFSFALLFFPNMLSSLFFSPEYAVISSMLPILGLYLLLYAIGSVFIQFLIAHRKDKTYFTIFLSSAIATVAFTFLVVPSYGIMGATLALCVPHGVACIAYCVCSLRYLHNNG